jgi:hypothetical protein
LIQTGLHQLSGLSVELEKEHDSIHRLLESTQTKLGEIGLDVPASIDAKTPGTRLERGYDRTDEWCLVYRWWMNDHVRWSEPQALVTATRDVGILALPLLPRLLGPVKDGTEKTRDSIRSAKARLVEELQGP